MRQNIKSLIQILDKWKWQYLGAAMLLLTGIFIRTLEPLILEVAVDGVISEQVTGEANTKLANEAIPGFFYSLLPENNAQSVLWVLVALGAIYLCLSFLRGGFILAAIAMNASGTEKAIKRLRNRIYTHIQSLPLGYFSKVSKGELIQRSTGDISTVRDFVLNQVIDVIRLTAIFLFSFIMMCTINVKFALISIMVVPIVTIGGYIFFKKEGKVWKKHEDEADKLNNIVQENLNGIRVVKALSGEDHEREKFDRQNRKKKAIGLKHFLLHTFFWSASDLIVNFQITISIMAGGYFALTNQITLGELLGCYAYIFMVAWPMRQAGRILSRMGMATVAMGRIKEILEATPEDYEGLEGDTPIEGNIEFKNVSFEYTGEVKDRVLKDISLKVNKGEKIAIIGPTGSGKSTLVKLLLRLYEPNEGEIFIDNKPLNDYARQALRKRIGTVLQNAFLFSTSIKGNISYISPGATQKEVEVAAEKAQIHQMMDVFSDGYDTLVGEKGVTLSGGQKQRVALARTILSNPDVFIFDDVTSAVDTETEHAIFEALESDIDQKTTIIISHRITSIQQADRILVMEKGSIVQEGTPDELALEEGYYRDILKIQTALELEIENTTH
jgi:ATP-binding cassette subfamily B protein